MMDEAEMSGCAPPGGWLAMTFFLLSILPGCTTITAAPTTVPPAPTAVFSHAEFAGVLARFVDGDGRVDYRGMVESPEDLDRYVDLLARYSPDSHPALFPGEPSRLAYWINGYNAAVMKVVITYYPIDSVQDVKAPFLFFFLPRGAGFFAFRKMRFGGQELSLYQLENDIVRERFDDPRIHFALNCASVGCPLLPHRPFSAPGLDDELDNEARRFVAEERNVRVDHAERVLYLSQIFEWYEADFVGWYRAQFPGREAGLVPYIRRYASAELGATLDDGAADYEIRFVPYDWQLNDQATDSRD